MTDIQAVQAVQTVQPVQPVQYVVIPAQEKEDKNFIEGLMWAGNGITNAVGGLGIAGSTIALNAVFIGTVAHPVDVVAGLVAVAALNVLAYYVVKAEFSIAGKSFTHMANTIL